MRKLIFLSLMLLISTPCFAANKYLSAALGTGNWSDATGTWVTASGGTTPIAAPTTADVCYLNAASGARTINVDATTNVCQQLITTGFTGTIDSTNAANILAISTTTTISATTNYGATAFTLRLGTGTSAAAWNLGGVTFPWDLELNGTGTKTVTGDVTVTGVTRMKASMTVTGSKWYANGGIESDAISSPRTMQGVIELIVGTGNFMSITKRTTGGKLRFAGDITIKGPTTGGSGAGIYDCDFAWVSGNVSVDPDVVFIIGGTNTIDVGNHIIFENLETVGTTTLLSDLYVAHSVQVVGTTTMTWAGAYTVHVGYGGGTGHLIMYNLGTHISTTTKISFEGTGTIFRSTSLNGMNFEAVNPWQIDLDINTAGTATFQAITAGNKWGNGRVLTYIAGTVVVTNNTWQVTTGGYAFNIDVTVPTFGIITTGVVATILSDFDCTTYGQIAGSTLSFLSGKTFTPSTNFYVNGTDSTTTTMNVGAIADFVGTNHPRATTTLLTSIASMGSGSGGAINQTLAGTNTIKPISLGEDWVFAIWIKRNALATVKILESDNGDQLQINSSNNSVYLVLNAGAENNQTNAYASWGTKARLVVIKQAGVGFKVYVNGNALGITASNTTHYNFTPNKFMTLTASGNVDYDETVILTGIPSDFDYATWVAADYDSGAGKIYTSAETYIAFGAHCDISTGLLSYNGTAANQYVFKETFLNVDASASAVPIITFKGASTNSENVFALSGENFKPYAVATA